MRLVVFLALLPLLSCTKESVPSPYNEVMDGMYSCQQANPLDSTATFGALIGTWDWRFVRSTSWEYYESEEEYRGFELTFESDGSVLLNQNDTASIEGTWTLENSWVSFSLSTQPYIPTVFGQALLCDDHLMFYSSPMDGPDHLYQKQ